MMNRLLKILPLITILSLSACDSGRYFNFKTTIPNEYNGWLVHEYQYNLNYCDFIEAVKKKTNYKDKDYTVIYSSYQEFINQEKGVLYEYLSFKSVDGKKSYSDYKYSTEDSMWKIIRNSEEVPPYYRFEKFLKLGQSTKWDKEYISYENNHHIYTVPTEEDDEDLLIKVTDDNYHVCDYYKNGREIQYLLGKFQDFPREKIPHIDDPVDTWIE